MPHYSVYYLEPTEVATTIKDNIGRYKKISINNESMWRLLILFLLLVNPVIDIFAQDAYVVHDSIWCDAVKTVSLTRSDIDLASPIVKLTDLGDEGERLMLRFDVLADKDEQFRYRIRHCDAEWHLDDLPPSEYINGYEEGPVEGFDYSFTTNIPYVNYHQAIPAQYVNFIASGNYVVEVFPEDDPDSIILTRRFWVSEDRLSIEATVTKPTGARGDLYHDQELSVSFTPDNGSFLPSNEMFYIVVAQQNQRTDLCRVLPFYGYQSNALTYRWHKENIFPGGNDFRFFDISDLRVSNHRVARIDQWGGETFVFLQPDEERSKKAYSHIASLNGGMKVNARDRNNPLTESDYVWVNFSLPMAQPLMGGSIHIVGELTQWRLDDNSRMDWQPLYKAYTKRLLLKQGYYSYQLLYLPAGETVAQTSTIEGDHNVTGNNYTIYIYYRPLGARYDRLVGVKTTY